MADNPPLAELLGGLVNAVTAVAKVDVPDASDVLVRKNTRLIAQQPGSPCFAHRVDAHFTTDFMYTAVLSQHSGVPAAERQLPQQSTAAVGNSTQQPDPAQCCPGRCCT